MAHYRVRKGNVALFSCSPGWAGRAELIGILASVVVDSAPIQILLLRRAAGRIMKFWTSLYSLCSHYTYMLTNIVSLPRSLPAPLYLNSLYLRLRYSIPSHGTSEYFGLCLRIFSLLSTVGHSIRRWNTLFRKVFPTS